ncbi:MAG: hypothetical protein WCD64_04755 [Pseudolabrys sp.]
MNGQRVRPASQKRGGVFHTTLSAVWIKRRRYMTKGQLAMAVAMIYPEPEKSAARNSLLAIASAATCRTSSSEKRPRGFSIAPTRSRKTERRSTGKAFAAVITIFN